MSNLGLLSEAEDIQFNQQCALTTLGIIQSSLEQEVTHIEASGALLAVGHLQDLSSAVYIISTLLYDLNERLKKAVDEEYKSRKKREQ
ncbi:MAG: hypothetical protein ACLU5G_13855 [Blautia sp.]|nr:MAG TPA: hypothetical protein [Caudoviricetes sp.]